MLFTVCGLFLCTVNAIISIPEVPKLAPLLAFASLFWYFCYEICTVIMFFVSFRMYSGKGRRFLPDKKYHVHTSSYHGIVSIPCNPVNRHFEEKNNLTITQRPSPDQAHHTSFQRPGPRPRPPWSYGSYHDFSWPGHPVRREKHMADRNPLPEDFSVVNTFKEVTVQMQTLRKSLHTDHLPHVKMSLVTECKVG